MSDVNVKKQSNLQLVLSIGLIIALIAPGAYFAFTDPRLERDKEIFQFLFGASGVCLLIWGFFNLLKKSVTLQILLGLSVILGLIALFIWGVGWFLDAAATAPPWAIAFFIYWTWFRKDETTSISSSPSPSREPIDIATTTEYPKTGDLFRDQLKPEMIKKQTAQKEAEKKILIFKLRNTILNSHGISEEKLSEIELFRKYGPKV